MSSSFFHLLFLPLGFHHLLDQVPTVSEQSWGSCLNSLLPLFPSSSIPSSGGNLLIFSNHQLLGHLLKSFNSFPDQTLRPTGSSPVWSFLPPASSFSLSKCQLHSAVFVTGTLHMLFPLCFVNPYSFRSRLQCCFPRDTLPNLRDQVRSLIIDSLSTI